jgi:phage shock protein PspC (stress-responsive transcriptional regulator)
MGDLRAGYRFLAPALRAAGYRVACTDLRGHGERFLESVPRDPGAAADGGHRPRINEGMAHMNTTNGTKVLVRSRKGRMVAGICAGVAGFFGWDVTVVRVIVAVVSVMTGGTGVLAYLVAWALIPLAGEKTSIAEDLISKTRQGSPG